MLDGKEIEYSYQIKPLNDGAAFEINYHGDKGKIDLIAIVDEAEEAQEMCSRLRMAYARGLLRGLDRACEAYNESVQQMERGKGGE